MKKLILLLFTLTTYGCSPQKSSEAQMKIISGKHGDYAIVKGQSDDELFQEAEKYMVGYGRKSDINKAVTIYSELANKGYTPAQMKLYDYLPEGFHSIVLNTKEIQDYIMSLDNNQLTPLQMYNMAVLSNYAETKEKDEKKSFEWMLKAAEAGYATAQYRLGIYYALGIGVPEDKKKAFLWYKKAAMSSHAEAQFTLSQYYRFGTVTDKNLENAFYWLKKSAMKGYVYAEVDYAKELVKRDKTGKEEESIQWFMKAAQKGDSEALFILAGYYIVGEKVKEDRQLAFKLLLSSAMLGYMNAQRSVGDLYLAGVTGVKDQKNAIYWYQKAAEQGDEHSKAKLDELIPQQKPEAKKNN
ncbi:MAG: tetratricopeptide repeat protein [Verrucomicrobiota bacterium]|nr:tetratricopeptide repeat protein [Verrucomicrobiota bacterium]